MGLFDGLFKKNQNIPVEQLTTLINDLVQSQFYNQYRYLPNATPIYGTFDKAKQISSGYLSNAGIYSVQRLIAKTAAAVPMCAYVVKDEKIARKLKSMPTHSFSDNYIEDWQKLHTKAYELVPESDAQKFYDNICPLYETQEFVTGVFIYRLSTGNSLVFKARRDNGEVFALYHMPVEHTSILATQNQFPKMVLGYEMTVPQKKDVSTDDVIHLKYFNPKYTNNGDELWGLSPIEVLMKEITADNEAVDSQVSQFKHGGPAVIIANKAIPASQVGVDLMGQIKDKWEKEKEGSKNRGKMSLMPGEVTVDKIGLSPVDLQILEGRRFTLSQYCSVFGISDVLLNNNEASTESNVKEQIRRLYSNAALPECYSWRNALNSHIAPQFSKRERVVYDLDISMIPELQADMLKTAQALSASPFVVPKDAFEKMSMNSGILPEEFANKVFMKQGYVPIEEVGLTDAINDPFGNNNQL